MTTETLRYLVEADYGQLRGLKNEIDGVNRKIGSSTSTAASQRAAFDRVGRSAGVLALGIGAVGAASFKSAADFDQSLRVFSVASEGGAQSMGRARAEAIKLGADIKLPGVSAKDAADAMVELAKGGFNVQQSIQAARGVLVLGQAANMDYATSATAIARTLKAFGMPATQAVTAVDAIAGAALKSTASMEEITKGMEFASTSAHTLGISVTDTATALAILNDAGISGAKAGTSMNMVLTRMAAPTKQGAAEMKRLGLDFFNAKGQFIGMRAATAQMTGALSKLNPEQRQAALQTMFAGTAMKAANLVFGKGTKNWDTYRKAVGKTGTAQKILDKSMGGSKGTIEALRNAVGTFAIVFGSALTPAIVAVLKPITSMLTWLTKYPGVVTAVVAVIGSLAASLWLANAAMKAVKTAQEVAKFFQLAAAASKAWAVANRILAISMYGLPIVWIIVALVAVGAALYLLWTKSETFRRIVTAAWEAVKRAGQALWDTLKAAFSGMVRAVTAAWDKIKSVTSTVWNAIKSFFARFWPYLLGAMAGPIGLIVALVIKNWDKVKQMTSTVWNAIKSAVMAVVNTLVGLVRGGATRIVSGFVAVLRTGIALGRAAMNAVKTAIVAVFGGAIRWLYAAGKAIIDGLIQGAQSMVGWAVDKVKGFGSRIKNAVLSPFHLGSPSRVMIAAGQDIARGLAVGIGQGTPAAEKAARAMAKKAVDAARAQVKQAASGLAGMLQFAFERKQAGMETEAGRQLRLMEEARAAQERQQALADAQQQIAAATNATEMAAAQKAYADAQYQIQVAALQKQADEQQAALDWQKQQQQAAFDKQLAGLQTYLSSGHATAAGAQKRIKAIMKQFGIDLSSMGQLIGVNFASAVEKQIPRVVAAAARLARAARKAIDKELHGSPWVTFTIGKTLSAELARGLEAGQRQASARAAAALRQTVEAPRLPAVRAEQPPRPAGQPQGFTMNVHGDMYVRDERDAELIASSVMRSMVFAT